VDWLRRYGLSKHPDWYPGYTSESTFEEVQDMLHGLGKAQCPRPCFAKMPAALLQTSSSLKFDCHDAVEGDWCYHSINWLREKGLHRHPDWYPTLEPSSNNSWIQAELHRKGKSDCPWPCGLTKEDDADEEGQQISSRDFESMLEPEQTTQDEQGEEGCRDAQPNTACYTAVTYGLAGGIKKHPEIYVGLMESADFKQVQQYLYLQNRNGCERPCSQKRVDPSKFFKSAANGDTFREKKRIEDMSAEELSKYLDGKWDGYDKKNFKVTFNGEFTSTFEKRDSIPTTTPFGAEEQQDLPLINPEASKITAAEADKYDQEEFARKLLEDKIAEEKMLSDATSTTAPAEPVREKKTVEDMSKQELSDYLNGQGNVEPDLPALGVVSTQKAIANDTADVASETEEAANGTEGFEALPALALENFSTVEESEEAGVSDEPMPAVDADGNFANQTEETAEEAERRMEMEQQPNVQTEEVERAMEAEQQPHAETPEEMESRIRAELMEKNFQALKASEEDMRARIKAEVMSDLSKDKGQ
jgi:hypothetical protein